MIRQRDVNVLGPDLVELTGNSAVGKLGTVAVAAKMGEGNVAKFVGEDISSEFGGVFVAEMAVPAKDALFGGPRAVRIVLEHFDVVVRF